MRIYVAGKFEAKEEVRRVQALVRAAGHTTAFDWTMHDDTGMAGEERSAYLRACGYQDFYGVLRADALVVLNHPMLYGGMLETGLALASGIAVHLVGQSIRDTPFFYLHSIRSHDTAEEAVKAIASGH